MADLVDIIKLMKDPFEILMAFLILWAFKTLGDKLKKIDHIDTLIGQVQNLVTKVGELIDSHDKDREETAKKIRDLESDVKHLTERIIKLETLQGGE